MGNNVFQRMLLCSGPDAVNSSAPLTRSTEKPAGAQDFGGTAFCPPPIEGLERRVLFAADAQVVGTVLVITGTSAGERIDVYQENGVNNDVIKVKFDGGTPFNFLDNQFTSIKVLAGAGADTIVFGNATEGLGDESVEFAALIYGEDGSDSVPSGTDGNDTIYGGYGNDTLEGDGGNDLIYGGMSGGSSGDTPGADDLYGRDGNDTLYGESGDDELFAGLGTDRLFGGDGNDFLRADDGNGEFDTLDGGSGTDSGWWESDDSTISMEGKF